MKNVLLRLIGILGVLGLTACQATPEQQAQMSSSLTSDQSATLQSMVASGTQPTHFVYALVSANNGIAQYYVDPASGALHAIPNHEYIGTGTNPISIKIHPNGKWMYSINYNTVSQYTIDTSTGILTQMSPATVAAPQQPSSFAFDSSGTILWVYGTTSLEKYSIDANTGALTFISYMATGYAATYAQSLGIDFSNKTTFTLNNFIYVLNSQNQTVDQYQVSPYQSTGNTAYAGPSLLSIAGF